MRDHLEISSKKLGKCYKMKMIMGYTDAFSLSSEGDL